MITSLTRSLVSSKQWYRSMLAGNEAYSPPGDFDLISTTLLSTSAASVTFDVTGLGSTYKHLQIRLTARSSSGNTYQDSLLKINGATSGYASHFLFGNGSAASSGNQTSSARIYYMSGATGGGAATGSFGAAVLDFLDPFSTSKNKVMRSFSGRMPTGTTEANIALGSGLWASTSAATSIEIYPDGAFSWVSGSRFSIYGIKG